MKHCYHCGNELLDEAVMCPKCGCMVEGAPASKAAPVQKSAPAPVNYKDAITGAGKNNLIALILLTASAAIWWFASVYGGAIIALIAELIALNPNSKLTRMCKKNGVSKNEMKSIKKDLKKSSRAFSASFVIGVIALIAMILFFATPEFLGIMV